MSPSPASNEALAYLVEGMSCGHCNVAVTEELSKVVGVSAVDVEIDTKLVRVHGTGVEGAAVVAAIEEAGYEAVAA
jgi:copper chaperone